MSELANLLARYGYGPQQPEADQQFVDTSNVLARVPKANPLVEALRIARDAIPENTELPNRHYEHAPSVGAAAGPLGAGAAMFPAMAGGASLVNMLRGGLDTASNWLDYRNKLSPDDYKASDTLAPLGAGVMGSAFAPQNALGIFGGRLAKTADHAALAKAEEMAAKGADKKAIWDQTGWFQGADGKWRFEIPDKNAKMNPPASWKDLLVGKRMQDVMSHDALFAAYPDINPTLVKANGSHAHFSPSTDEIGLTGILPRSKYNDAKHYNGAVEYQKSTALHELQHAVQMAEGMEPGGSHRIFTQDQIAAERNRLAAQDDGRSWTSISNYTPDMSDEQIVHGLYRRLAGEVEARNVQSRMKMTPEQRAKQPPWTTEDVAQGAQIKRLK